MITRDDVLSLGVAKLFTYAQWSAPLALTRETQVQFLVMSLSVLTS
jgi:hypothetical protein